MKGLKTGGRQAGTPNKVTAEAKAAIEECFRRLGDVDALVAWAEENRSTFYEKIWPKVMPLQVKHGGDDENESPIVHEIRRVIVDPSNT